MGTLSLHQACQPRNAESAGAKGSSRRIWVRISAARPRAGEKCFAGARPWRRGLAWTHGRVGSLELTLRGPCASTTCRRRPPWRLRWHRARLSVPIHGRFPAGHHLEVASRARPSMQVPLISPSPRSGHGRWVDDLRRGCPPGVPRRRTIPRSAASSRATGHGSMAGPGWPAGTAVRPWSSCSHPRASRPTGPRHHLDRSPRPEAERDTVAPGPVGRVGSQGRRCGTSH